MVEVIKTGLYSTIQDGGRWGKAHLGVPVSGAMDAYAATLANALLDNPKETAVLEMTMIGVTLKFHTSTTIAISGATMEAHLNDGQLSNYKVYHVNPNDTLRFGRVTQGYRTYLAIKGGFNTEEVLGSRSMYKGITKGSTLQKGGQLPVNNTNEDKGSSVKPEFKDTVSDKILYAYKGPEFDALPQSAQEQLLNNDFTVSNFNNRMAYQLEELIENELAPIITAPVLPGTVQLTPSGKLIVLMRDAQTTGGYPRVLQLTEMAINTLSQKMTANRIIFRLKE